MGESGCIDFKLDCSKAKKHAAGEPVAAGSAAEQSITGDFLRQCCLVGDGAADVSFLVGGDKFRAHPRAVLAAGSPVFKDLLFSPAASSTDDGVRVRGVEPESFRVLLRFMYADDALPGDDETKGASTAETLRNLVAAADMYGMERLKLACAEKLWEHVSAETVAATLGFAETHGCPELKNRCLDFLAEEENLRKAALSEGYVQLVTSFPSILEELRSRLCPRLESSDFEDFCSLF
ncbi:BTB/POZ and MATH domain-containing protein 3-like [Panicum virgatum]|uniref:BTB domain-containing protein n=1 Tax=Panicum virgatum TaxID=38727 RepID=A0A8T0R357_PANVG|nr:BTB/POZ and MATH domain-containing protein 3-like [Panicum virgatum]KAG2580072.1 hypothetical protein PVAP13_6NG270337 [Panicum virgatum]